MTKLSPEDVRRIREILTGLEVRVSEKELRELYNSNPRFQKISFELFALRVLKIKTIVDNTKYQFGVE